MSDLKKREVRFAQLECHEHIFRPSGYKFFTTEKHGRIGRFLGRLARAFLKKYRFLEPYYFKETIYSYGESERFGAQEHFTDQLWLMWHGVVEKGGSPSDFCFLLGGKQFHDLVRGWTSHDAGVLEIWSDSLKMNGPGYSGRYFGLPIYVVPSMDGAIIVPKVVVERQARPDELDYIKRII